MTKWLFKHCLGQRAVKVGTIIPRQSQVMSVLHRYVAIINKSLRTFHKSFTSEGMVRARQQTSNTKGPTLLLISINTFVAEDLWGWNRFLIEAINHFSIRMRKARRAYIVKIHENHFKQSTLFAMALQAKHRVCVEVRVIQLLRDEMKLLPHQASAY